MARVSPVAHGELIRRLTVCPGRRRALLAGPPSVLSPLSWGCLLLRSD